MRDASTEEGTTSRYQVLGRLAGGGMADIYLARAISAGGVERHVVLKRVLAERARDPHLMKMFLDEARLAVQLHHPNIAQVFDFGKLGGSYFFTMEYIHGVDVRVLRHRLTALGRPLPVNLAFYIATGVLAGLHHAHERAGSDGSPLGVVHRDISPSNVMVSFDGAIKLLDFGVAKASQHTAESRTGVKGKITYLSPEQCRGKDLDRRSDLFSMGIVLHEMLTGQRLYKRDSDFDTMHAIVMDEPPAPSSIRGELSKEIDRIVLRALAKDPDQRYATAAEMAEDLETIAVREYLRLSATVMGKYMRELFGERPEPWTELATRDDARPFTVTSSVGESGDAPRAVGSNDPQTHDSFEVQLDRAPVWRIDEAMSSGRAPSTSELDRVHPRFGTSTPSEPVVPSPPPLVPQPPVVSETAPTALIDRESLEEPTFNSEPATTVDGPTKVAPSISAAMAAADLHDAPTTLNAIVDPEAAEANDPADAPTTMSAPVAPLDVASPVQEVVTTPFNVVTTVDPTKSLPAPTSRWLALRAELTALLRSERVRAFVVAAIPTFLLVITILAVRGC